MDILYYSNNCKYSKHSLQFFVKNNLVDKLHFICVDRRRVDPVSGQLYIQLENGKEILLPPNVHSVPCLLLTKENYRVLYGSDIVERFQKKIESDQSLATQGNGEPMGYSLGGNVGVVSESFTFFQASVEDLSAKGTGGLRPLNNYVSARDETSQYTIHTPPETYRNNKLDNSITIEKIEKKRSAEITPTDSKNLPFLPQAI
jgi:hypothetical protein